MKILLIEDEAKVSALLKKGLEEQGHDVKVAFDGNSGLALYRQSECDLIIMDIVMPGISGLELCRKIRESGNDYTPILMLTALGTTEDIVEGLNTGADDYLTKPFRFKELLARINALGRMHKKVKAPEKILTAGDLELHTALKEVRRAGIPVDLTALEYRLLEYLMINKNRVVSRIDILENVWHDNVDVTSNIVEVYISYLRNKIDKNHTPKLIRTIIGMGYAIKDQG
ncbi:MAG: response regulator transcription factor [Flavobacteriales bacterium]|nr:response regulator transcription factor [Flavobacteriales bacterium]